MLNRSWKARIGWPLSCLLLLACGEAFTAGSGGSGGSGGFGGDVNTASSSSSSGEGGSGACGRPISPIEPGFDGPFVVVNAGDDPMPPCPNAKMDFHADVVADAAVCTCSCGAEAGNCTVDFKHAPTANCDGGSGPTPLYAGCNSNPPGGAGSGYFGISLSDAPVCQPGSTGEQKSEVVLLDRYRSCSVPVGEQGGKLCLEGAVPQGYSNAVCIGMAGTPACPEDYPKSYIVYSGFSDTRGCDDDCSCAQGTAQCGGSVQVFENVNDCSNNGGTPATQVLPSCGYYSGVQSVNYQATLSGECGEPNHPTAQGEVNPTNAYTFCCEDNL